MIDITKFNFLPATYDRIIYLDQGTINIPNAGTYYTKTVNTNNAGLFLPVLTLSVDGVNWYDSIYPPQDESGTMLANGFIDVRSSQYTIEATKSTSGTLHYKVMGIEI